MTISGEQVRAAIHRYRYVLLAVYSLGFLPLVGLIAARRSFWYDEAFTLLIGSLPSAGAIWTALAQGAENQPPLNFWLVHATLPLSGTLEISARIPAMVSFWLMTLCLYRIVARETDTTHGFIALLIPFAAPTLYFAYEARAYGPLFLCAAASVLFWQMAKGGERRTWSLVLLSVSLAASVYVHYYGVLVYVPFVVTELAVGLMKKRWDWPIWLAIVLSGIAVLPLAPLMLAVGGFTSMFVDPSLVSVQGLYARLLGLPAVIFGLLTLAAGLMGPARTSSAVQADSPKVLTSRRGTLLLLMFCLLPVPGFFMARLATNAWADRYFIFSLVGFSVAFALMVYQRWRDRPWLSVGCVGVLALVAGLEARQHYSRPEYRAAPSVDVADAVRGMRQLPQGTEPLLLPGMYYLPVYHYSSAAVRTRLLFLDEDPAHFTVAAQRLRVVRPIPIASVEDVSRQYARFYVYRASPRLMKKLRNLSMQVTYVDHDWYYVAR
jgi:hypothetical protein